MKRENKEVELSPISLFMKTGWKWRYGYRYRKDEVLECFKEENMKVREFRIGVYISKALEITFANHLSDGRKRKTFFFMEISLDWVSCYN